MRVSHHITPPKYQPSVNAANPAPIAAGVDMATVPFTMDRCQWIMPESSGLPADLRKRAPKDHSRTY